MKTNILGLTTVIVVGIVILGSLLVPVIHDASYTTTTISNEGAGDLRYAYHDEPTAYTSEVIYDDDNDEIVFDVGSASQQTVAATDTICWASDLGSIIYSDGGFTLLYEDNGSTTVVDLGESYSISGSSGGVGITGNGLSPIEIAAVSWEYIPDGGGDFGLFGGDSTDIVVDDYPVAAMGHFAGVFTYNEINSLGLADLTHTYTVADNVFVPNPWIIPSEDAKSKITPIHIFEEKTTEEKTEKKTTKAVPTPDYTDGDWGFNISGANATIVSYSGASGNISIPSTVTTGGTSYAVTQLGIGTFMPIFDNTAISGSTITIPDSVTSIGNFAFDGCSGFTGSLVIPDSVTSIGNYAFSSCSGFTGSLVIPDSVTSISDGAFDGCSGFTGSLVIPDSVTTIGKSAFKNCSGFTGSLVIPDSVTSIGTYAFNNCSGFTGSLVIPDSVTSISDSAFKSCSGFTGSLVIPDSVTSIDNFAFNNCSGFTGSLVIPDSVTSIGDSAFNGCGGFTGSLVIPDSVTSIGKSAFNGCGGFTGSLVIPDSVTSIGTYAFRGCYNISGLVILGDITSIGTDALYMVSLTEVLNLGDTVLAAGDYGIPSTATVDDEIALASFLAPVSISTTVKNEGAAYDLLGVIPLVIICAILIAAVRVVSRGD